MRLIALSEWKRKKNVHELRAFQCEVHGLLNALAAGISQWPLSTVAVVRDEKDPLFLGLLYLEP